MEKYKIKITNDVEAKECSALMKELGYKEDNKFSRFTSRDNFGIACSDGSFGYGPEGMTDEDDQELTLPQLRDLVVLKRNDINDANWETEGGDQIFNDSNNKSYIYRTDGWDEVQRHEMRQAMWEKPKAIAKPQDPALISGDVALANVHKCTVQYLHDDEPYGRWTTITDHFWSQYHLGMFLDPDTKFKFRFKPQTIKLELELPKPFEPKVGDIYWFLSPFYSTGYDHCTFANDSSDKLHVQYGAYRSEDDVKKAVEQLRKIRGAS